MSADLRKHPIPVSHSRSADFVYRVALVGVAVGFLVIGFVLSSWLQRFGL